MTADLRTELKQARPFHGPEHEAWLSITRTAAVLEHGFDTWLKPYGITSTQYNVLRILRGAGPGGLCRSEIGGRMVRPVPDVTRLLDRLEEQQLIARSRGGLDRRYVTATITTGGLDLLERLDDPVDDFHRSALGHLGKGPLQQLVALLSAAREGHADEVVARRAAQAGGAPRHRSG